MRAVVAMIDSSKSWMSEVKKYDYTYRTTPDYTQTGHFTQVVWKSTTQVACASAYCPSGVGPNFPGKATFLVCRYSPPGNYPNKYKENVGTPK